MKSNVADGAQSTPPVPRRISFTQLVPGDNCKCDINFSFRDGIALVIQPGEGVIVEGKLLDCPEQDPDTGWVVLEAGGRLIAAASPSFRQLMIENSPCHLRLESVCRPDQTGRQHCDWIAYELSPAGGKILVSDKPPVEEIVAEPREDLMPGGEPALLEEYSRTCSGQTKNRRDPSAIYARSKNCRAGGGGIARGVIAMFVCLVAGCGPSRQTAIDPLDVKSSPAERRDNFVRQLNKPYNPSWPVENPEAAAGVLSNITETLRWFDDLKNLPPDQREAILDYLESTRRPPCSLRW